MGVVKFPWHSSNHLPRRLRKDDVSFAKAKSVPMWIHLS